MVMVLKAGKPDKWIEGRGYFWEWNLIVCIVYFKEILVLDLNLMNFRALILKC